MINVLYVIWDKEAEESSPIFGCKNDAMAQRFVIREIKRCMQDGIYKNPDEFLAENDVYKIAKFDTTTMKIFDANPQKISVTAPGVDPEEEVKNG